MAKFITGYKNLRKRYGHSPTTFWRMIKAGDFPPPVKISPRLNSWSEEILDQHDAKKIKEAAEKAEAAGVGANGK